MHTSDTHIINSEFSELCDICISDALESKIDDDAERTAKLVVDAIYEQMQHKIAHKLIIFEGHKKKDGIGTKYINDQVKWWKRMLGHVNFLRMNRAYVGLAKQIIKKEYNHGT